MNFFIVLCSLQEKKVKTFPNKGYAFLEKRNFIFY